MSEPFRGKRYRRWRRKPYPALPVSAFFVLRTEQVLFTSLLARQFFDYPPDSYTTPAFPAHAPGSTSDVTSVYAGQYSAQFSISLMNDTFYRFRRFPFDIQWARYYLPASAFPYAELRNCYQNLATAPRSIMSPELPGMLNSHQFVRWVGTEVYWKAFRPEVRQSTSIRLESPEESTGYLGGSTSTPVYKPVIKPRVYYVASRAIPGLLTVEPDGTLDSRILVSLLEAAVRNGVARRLSWSAGKVNLKPLAFDTYQTYARAYPPPAHQNVPQYVHQVTWARGVRRYPEPIPVPWITDFLSGQNTTIVPAEDSDAYRRDLLASPFTEGFLYFFHPLLKSATRLTIGGGVAPTFTQELLTSAPPDFAIRVTWEHKFELSIGSSSFAHSSFYPRVGVRDAASGLPYGIGAGIGPSAPFGESVVTVPEGNSA